MTQTFLFSLVTAIHDQSFSTGNHHHLSNFEYKFCLRINIDHMSLGIIVPLIIKLDVGSTRLLAMQTCVSERI